MKSFDEKVHTPVSPEVSGPFSQVPRSFRRRRSPNIREQVFVMLIFTAFLSLAALFSLRDEASAQASRAGSSTKPTAEPVTSASSPEHFLAKVYDENSNKGKLLFTYQHLSTPTPNGHVLVNTYYDSDHNVVAVETTEVVKNGDHEDVRSYKMSQKQNGSEGSVEIKDGEAHFSYTKDGKTKTSSEKVDERFVVGPTVVPYLGRHWEQIEKGDAVKARFAVLDRAETVGFEYFKEKTDNLGGEKLTVVKMKPSSLLISAIVDPLHFYLTSDGRRVREVHGRTQLKQKRGNSLEDLDAVTTYEY